MNLPSLRRSKHIAESVDRRKHTAIDDPDTPMLVASQAFVSESLDPPISMAQMMMSFMQKIQDREDANQKRNLEMMELHRLETESKLEQQCRDMDMRLEQQRMEMATIAEKIVKNVVNQVPLIV